MVNMQELHALISSGKQPTILDVRPPTEFGICHIPGSRSMYKRPRNFTLPGSYIPFSDVPVKDILKDPKAYVKDTEDAVYVVCRLGNDSQIAAASLRDITKGLIIKDLTGGLRAWSEQVDPTFPIY